MFKPKVKVVDNWEWCNGTCINVEGASDASKGTGCLNGIEDVVAVVDCDSSKSGTQYNGIIVVVEDKN